MSDNLLGRAVRGDIYPTDNTQYEQWTESEFLAYVDEVLERPGVEALYFEAYTPYFNDGEACVWHMGTVAVKVPSWPEPEDAYGPEGFHTTEDSECILGYRYDRDPETRQYKRVDVGVRDQALTDALSSFEQAGKHFETVIKNHFGDHCYVICTSDGFEVSNYEHD